MARTTDNGYGWTHQQLRESLRPAVEAGEVDCWRCARRIWPGQRWELGHDDEDRTVYRGPEHLDCNRRAAAEKVNAARRSAECWCGGCCKVHVAAEQI